MIKSKKVYLLFCIPLLLIILSLNSVFALACWIESSVTSPAAAASGCNNAQIDGVNGSVMMYLSATTNAHGALSTSPDYNNVLCCTVGATASPSCSTGIEILGLSSTTNAHAEKPSFANYTNGVCSNGFNDIIVTSSAPPGGSYINLVSISSNGNAHLGNYTDYTVVVYGNATPIVGPGLCDLTSATWSQTAVNNGTQVSLIVGGSAECSGEMISFEVKRNGQVVAQPASVAFGQNGAWTATPASNDNYTFTATVVGSSPIETQDSSNQLQVNELPSWCTDGIPPDPVLCRDYTTEANCTAAAGGACNIDVQDSFSPALNVDCSDPQTTCFCAWDDGAAEGEKCGPSATYDSDCGNGVVEPWEVCDGTNFTKSGGGNWNCNDPLLGFSGGTLVCNPPGTPNECTPDTSQCTNYQCNNNGTRELGREACDGLDVGVAECNDFDEFTTGTLLCDNSCNFNFTQCSGAPIGGAGTCYYTADTSDTCDDGLLTVIWHTTWVGPTGGSLWDKCVNIDDGKADSLACPAQIPLPFFNLYNLLAAVAIIAIIYLAMHARKGRRKG